MIARFGMLMFITFHIISLFCNVTVSKGMHLMVRASGHICNLLAYRTMPTMFNVPRICTVYVSAGSHFPTSAHGIFSHVPKCSITFIVSVPRNFARVVSYMVYLATDPFGAGRVQACNDTECAGHSKRLSETYNQTNSDSMKK